MKKTKGPFHVVAIRHKGRLVRYDIRVGSRPFLRGTQGATRLRRHEAYAIVNLLNTETRARKWAAKFSDPYA